MSKLIKVVLILAVAAIAIAAKQYASSVAQRARTPEAASISPAELTRKAGPLPELNIENLF